MALETEIERYNELLPELLKSSEGKFAVIHDRDFLGVFETISEAYSAGLEAFGVVSFLLREITAKQPVLVMREVPAYIRYV